MTDGGSTKQHIVVLGAQPEWLSGLRGPMIRDFLSRGHRVTAIGAEEIPHVRAALESWGAHYVVVPIRRAGLNPLADASAMIALWRTLRRLRPDMVFAYTVKPVVYGMPVAWAAGVKQRFAMITGRGYSFQPGAELSRRIARVAATLLYRFGLRFANGVLFHNDDDRRMFQQTGMLSQSTRVRRIWGSGIDLAHHLPEAMPTGPMRFLMVGRLIQDKGVREFVSAAESVKHRHPDVEFRLVGPTDPSPNGVNADEIARWKAVGAVDYIGPVLDVRPEIAACHVLVLPSYAEGLPRSTLEAMAAGRAVITTDAPGCADTVKNGESGWVVPVRDAAAIADAMEKCIADPAFVARAGQAGLAYAHERFDVAKVNAAIADFLGLAQSPSATSPPS